MIHLRPSELCNDLTSCRFLTVSLCSRPISSFPLSVLPETGPDSTCLDALNYVRPSDNHVLFLADMPFREQFQQGRSHILVVSNVRNSDAR